MTVDTAQKRFSAIHHGCPWRIVPVVPTGTIGANVRQAIACMYSGIAAELPGAEPAAPLNPVLQMVVADSLPDFLTHDWETPSPYGIWFDTTWGLGEVITLPGGQTIDAIFTDFASVGGEIDGPEVILAEADIDTYSIVLGMTITARGRDFPVQAIERDGRGGAVLRLFGDQ